LALKAVVNITAVSNLKLICIEFAEATNQPQVT